MSDNIPNTLLPKGAYIDLYASTGITIGTKIEVQNIGVDDIRLYSQAASPVNGDTSGYQVIDRGEYMENDEGDLGAWAVCMPCDGLLNIKVAS
jgi:hypothetical protein